MPPRLLLFAALLCAILVTVPVSAAPFEIACSAPDLTAALDVANNNAQADTLALQPGCTYTLTATLTVSSDRGNLLTIYGRGATLSGNNAVQILKIESGANASISNVAIIGGSSLISGGIENQGMLTLADSTISGFSASYGSIYNRGTFTLTNSTISGNSAGYGGGLYNDGTLIVTGSTVSGNSASGGGGISNFGTLTLTSSTVSGNSAGYGGGIFNHLGTLTLTSSTVSGNSAYGAYSISDVRIFNPTTNTFSGDSVFFVSGYGGGIYNEDRVTLINSTVTGNAAYGGLGAGSGLSAGGGIYNVGMLSLTGSIVSGNSASNAGGIDNRGTLALNNSIVSGNSAYGGLGAGGGIYNDDSATLTNSTLSGNSAAVGGGIDNFAGEFTLNNSIVVGSTGSDCQNFSTFTASHSLVQDGTCISAGTSGNLSGDPDLNGSLRPLPGSPVINAGDNTLVTSTTDKAGSPRIQGAIVDMGAYEFPLVEADATLPPAPPVPTCETHNFDENGVVRSSMEDAQGTAVNCRVLYQNGIATTWLASAPNTTGNLGAPGRLVPGVRQAIDVFSPYGLTHFEDGVLFCLRGAGLLLWLPASSIPHPPEIMNSYTARDFPGFTCATLFEPGTLVLVSQQSSYPDPRPKLATPLEIGEGGAVAGRGREPTVVQRTRMRGCLKAYCEVDFQDRSGSVPARRRCSDFR